MMGDEYSGEGVLWLREGGGEKKNPFSPRERFPGHSREKGVRGGRRGRRPKKRTYKNETKRNRLPPHPLPQRVKR